MLRYLSAGESHGKALNAVIEGLPAGLELNQERIELILKRRQAGYGRGGRMAIEQDRVEFIAGLRYGVTLGSPLSLLISNRDWENWRQVMEPAGRDVRTEKDSTVVREPRPGHADLPGGLKYRQSDLRNVLERASARETAIRTAVGAVAEELLLELGIRVQGQVIAVGGVGSELSSEPAVLVDEEIYANPFFCPDNRAVEKMMAEVDRAKASGDSLGGIVQVVADGLPPGLGSHVHWDRRLDGMLAQAVMSIPAIKGIEIGLGFAGAALPGSRVHDEISFAAGRGYCRQTNRAGGLEGGMTNGEPLVVRAAMKPIPTLYTPLATVDILTKERALASVERSDVCAVPAAAIVAEAAVAWVLAVVMMEKFGGDHLEETVCNYRNYLAYLKSC